MPTIMKYGIRSSILHELGRVPDSLPDLVCLASADAVPAFVANSL